MLQIRANATTHPSECVRIIGLEPTEKNSNKKNSLADSTTKRENGASACLNSVPAWIVKERQWPQQGGYMISPLSVTLRTTLLQNSGDHYNWTRARWQPNHGGLLLQHVKEEQELGLSDVPNSPLGPKI